MNFVNQSIIENLINIKGLKLQEDISLKEISNWKVGGKAKVLIKPESVHQIVGLMKLLTKEKMPSLVIGNTTNLLFTDENIDAVLIQIGSNYSNFKIEGNIVVAQPGIWVPRLARIVQQAGLTGIEHICGIPGTLGGLVVMNGGSQRKGIGEHISYVKTVDEAGDLKVYSQAECIFGYRSSIFQNLTKEIIIEVGLDLAKAESKKLIHAEMLSILRSRSKKFPRKLPNCGSVFVSNPMMYQEYGPPGKIIEDCGFKGRSKGGAQVSPYHANFIVNNGDASSNDILFLIKAVRAGVYNKTGYLMDVEARYINHHGRIQSI